jgi:hypothetical protein
VQLLLVAEAVEIAGVFLVSRFTPGLGRGDSPSVGQGTAPPLP